jgi:hypothetical protein
MRRFTTRQLGSSTEEQSEAHTHDFHVAWTDCDGSELIVSMECALCSFEMLLVGDLDEQDAECQGRSPLPDGGPWRRKSDGTIEAI